MKHIRLTLIALAAVLALGTVPAFAAPSTPATVAAPEASMTVGSTKPVKADAGGPLDCQIWPGQEGQTVVITSVEVPTDVKLPAKVRIPIVPGTTVQWVGEVMGADVNADVQQPYTLIQGEGGQFVEFTLTKARRGQVDAIGFPLKADGDTVSVDVEWVQSVNSVMTTLSVRIPPNTSKIKIEPKPAGEPVSNELGESLYTLEAKQYKPGEKQNVSISYSTKPPVEPAPGSSATPILIGLAAALIVAVAILVFVIMRQRGGGEPPTDAEDTPYDARPASRGSSRRGKAPAEGDDDASQEPAGTDDDEPFLDFS